MSKTKTTAAQKPEAQQNAPKRPSHRVYQVEQRGEEKAFWREVGVAWENADGSLNLQFAVIPMIGTHTIQVRKIEEDKAE